jgi:GTPase SAR1 family protein
MKIVMAGPSGSGKTTLSKALAAHYGLEFTENSAGMVMLPEDKRDLKERWGYAGEAGQVGVINLSAEHPLFGFQFQEAILRARHHLFTKSNTGVFDRSPMDPMVFFMNQCVHNFSDQVTKNFLDKCADVFFQSGITHVIRIPNLNPREVEHDGSRCSNKFFQKKIDKLFDWAIDYLLEHHLRMPYNAKSEPIQFYKVDTWDWQLRLGRTVDFISKYKTHATI